MERFLACLLQLGRETLSSESFYSRAVMAQGISEVVSQLRGAPYPILQDLERVAFGLEESLAQR